MIIDFAFLGLSGVLFLSAWILLTVVNKRLAEMKELYTKIFDIRDEYEAHIEHLQTGYMAELNVVEQALGAALGYTRYCDNPEVFPDATDADGVCVGIHAAGTLAMEAADVITALKARIAELEVDGGSDVD